MNQAAEIKRIEVTDELINLDQPLSRLWINGWSGGVPNLLWKQLKDWPIGGWTVPLMGLYNSTKNRILLIYPYSIDFSNQLNYNERVGMILINT